MATRRERNNLASKKSYEKAQERAHATDYEFAIIERHLAQFGGEAWHWSIVPEDHLFEAGYIHDFAKHRLMRLMNKKRMEEGENRLRDYGLDGLARQVLESGEVVYHGLQAKYYTSRSVTAEDIGSFFAKQISMTMANPLSRGYLYTTTRLQADLADEVKQPTYPIRHVLFPWRHVDRRVEPAMVVVEDVMKECDLPLRDYQVEVLAGLVDGRNAVCIPCRMGKTLIAGHWTKRLKPSMILAIAPLKVSVENLRERLACFLPGHAPLLVDSDAGGTTDEKEIEIFLEEHMAKGESVVVYSTFQSAEDILAKREWEEDTVVLVDEAHNAMGREDLCEWIQGFRRCLAMSATFPEEVEEAMGIEHKVVVPFSKGIEGGYIVDYTLWLPSLTKHEDGSTSVEAEIPIGFEAYERSMVLKALYHAVCMLRTGSRRTIVYLGSQVECDEYMVVCRRVLEEYHGVVNIWMGKMTCTVNSKERKAILAEFQGGEAGSFRILTSVRILDEAVDIPSCDSVFITTVGERSSDIRFFQRAQRSGTLDPKNPMKRNNIFLWAEGWERCVGALSLLREADPKFHAKVRHAGVGYDKKELIQERAKRVARERVEFTEWTRMACETVEERVRRKCQVLLEFVEREGRVPPYREVYQDVRIGMLWADVKAGHNKDLYRTLLSSCPILRQDYERLEQEREEKKGEDKKGEDKKTPEEKGRILMEWVEREQRVPPVKEVYRGVRIGMLWTNVKTGHYKDLYRTLLSSCPILREDYVRMEQEREDKKGEDKKTPEEKGRILMEWVEREQRVPPVKEVYQDVRIGLLWTDVKTGHYKDLYRTLLSSCPILRQDYERLEQEREEKKTPEEKGRILMEWVEREQRVPPKKEVYQDVRIGLLWMAVKRGQNKDLYRILLSTNPLLKADYERVQLLRQQKKNS